MRKIQAFFTGIFLLMAVFAMLVLVTLVYRANERSSIKSYIFQMANNANQRVGTLQNLDDISANDLRDKLITKYVNEYFKVIPGDPDVTKRPSLKNLSSPKAFAQWQENEAKIIAEMSGKNMFRMVRVAGIATYDKNPENINDNSNSKYYGVQYYTSTWPESNVMAVEPVYEKGVLYIEAVFDQDSVQKKNINVRSYLESGGDPVGLFRFYVVNIGEKQ